MSWFNFIFCVNFIFLCFWVWKYMIMSSKETTVFSLKGTFDEPNWHWFYSENLGEDFCLLVANSNLKIHLFFYLWLGEITPIQFFEGRCDNTPQDFSGGYCLCTVILTTPSETNCFDGIKPFSFTIFGQCDKCIAAFQLSHKWACARGRQNACICQSALLGCLVVIFS